MKGVVSGVRVGRVAARVLKWALVAILGLEVVSFCVVTLSNLVVYGSVWEGSRVNYDGYTLFQEGPRATLNNPPTTALPEAGHRILWVFGGSTTRGATDDDAMTIPSLLAGRLNVDPGSGPAVTVRNFGENSFNSLLETRYLQKALIEEAERPDVVIFYDGANEAVYFSQLRTPYAHHGYLQVEALIESHRRSLLGLLKPVNAAYRASSTRELASKINQTLIPIRRDSPELRGFVDRTVQRYDYLHEQAGLLGAEFVLFWQPVLWSEGCDVPVEVSEIERAYLINKARFTEVRENFRVVQGALAEALAGRPYFVDIREALCARSAPTYQPDGVHLTDEGRKMVASVIERALLERGVFDR